MHKCVLMSGRVELTLRLEVEVQEGRAGDVGGLAGPRGRDAGPPVEDQRADGGEGVGVGVGGGVASLLLLLLALLGDVAQALAAGLLEAHAPPD